MAQELILSEDEIELLREACAAADGVIPLHGGGDLQARFAWAVNAARLASLGYLEATDDGWRVKPDLRAQIKAVLGEFG